MKKQENAATKNICKLSRREVLVGGAAVAVGMGLPTLAFAKKSPSANAPASHETN